MCLIEWMDDVAVATTRVLTSIIICKSAQRMYNAAARWCGMIQFLQRNRNSNHNDAVPQQKVREVLWVHR